MIGLKRERNKVRNLVVIEMVRIEGMEESEGKEEREEE